MNIIELKKLTHGLRVLGMHETLESRIAQAEADNQSYTEFLAQLLEDEKLFRGNRTTRMLETKAKFRTSAAVEDWDTSFDRGITKTKLRSLATLSFVHEKRNLLICGSTGEGKTHLAISIGRAACQQGFKVAFLSTNQFFEESEAQRAAGKHQNWISKLKKHDVIIFDDFALRNYSHSEANVLLDLLEDRYRKGVHIFTTQVDPEGWENVFQDKVISEAIIDRVTHPSEKLILKGGSYREKFK
jgi:DNA replication protein DnaC